MAAVLAITGPYAATRYESGDGATKYPDGKTHFARDIFLPLGSWIYLPFNGTFLRWSMSNSDGSPGMGRIAYVKDDQGRTWRFIHIAIADYAGNLKPGDRVSEGTRLGRTSTHNLGAGRSHLHLDVFPAGVSLSNQDGRVDPLPILGVSGVNRMIGGGGGGGGPVIALLAAAGVWYWYSSKRTLRT